MQKFSQVKFRKDIWGKPVILSHELCLYITRFVRVVRSLPVVVAKANAVHTTWVRRCI